MHCSKGFALDARLENDAVLLLEVIDKSDFACQIRLSKDARYPWCLLVPMLNDLSELTDLSIEQQLTVLKVSNILTKTMQSVFTPQKMNLACIGNIVKQLHIHHVARYEHDEAWPAPIWGLGQATKYSDHDLMTITGTLRKAIAANLQGDLYVNYDNQ